MDQEVARHEKIRFRREEITDFHAFPSAAGLDQRLMRPSLARRAAAFGLKVCVGLVALVVVAALAIYAIGASGLGSERLRIAAEEALQEAAGDKVTAHVGPARLTWDPLRLLAAEVSDVSVASKQGGQVAEVGSVRFGIHFLPLLSGQFSLGSAVVSDARIMPGAMEGAIEGGDNGDWAKDLRDERGLIDPDRVVTGLYAAVRSVLDVMGPGKTRQIALANVDVVLSNDGEIKVLRIVQATVEPAVGGSLAFASELDVDGRPVSIKGQAVRDPGTGKVADFDAAITMADAKPSETPSNGSANRIGEIAVRPEGRELHKVQSEEGRLRQAHARAYPPEQGRCRSTGDQERKGEG